MFVAMRASATEVEVLGVKSRILAEGLTPFDHRGPAGTVIAVVGDVATRRAALIETLAALPGVERVTPISPQRSPRAASDWWPGAGSTSTSTRSTDAGSGRIDSDGRRP